MDIFSSRVAFALIATTMLVLFYVGTYRSTRAAYCGLWCLSLVGFLSASLCWLLNESAHQIWANPLGNVISTAASGSVWWAARTVWREVPHWTTIGLPAVFVGLISILDDPGTNIWAGNEFYFAILASYFGLTAYELLGARRESRVRGIKDPSVSGTLCTLAGVISVFYLLRAVFLTILGPDSDVFLAAFGGIPTTLLNMTLLVAVSHSMVSLSREQMICDLRRRAERDPLTGLLNRQAFMLLAAEQLRSVSQAAIVIADLDEFKRINDHLGHTTGDRVLVAFSQAITGAIRSTDLSARYGGEEFLILMPSAGPQAAHAAATGINSAFADSVNLPGHSVSASFGIATVDAQTDLATAIDQADAALYLAKRQGRNRAVIYSGDEPWPSPLAGPTEQAPMRSFDLT